MLRPVPEFIAAVIPTIRSSRRHSRTSAFPNTSVYAGGGGGPFCLEGAAFAGGPPEVGLGLGACPLPMPPTAPSSAGAHPPPLAGGPTDPHRPLAGDRLRPPPRTAP